MKKFTYTSFALIIMIALILSLIPAKPLNAYSEGIADVMGYQFEYKYSDSYFAQASDQYLNPLADISLISCLASCDEETAKTYYGELGFRDITFNEGFKDTDHSDKIGLVAARKDIRINGEDVALVMLNVRGVNYGIEWADNFNVGDSGNHEGFSNNSRRAVEFITNYVEDQRLENKPLKIWICGYSRGGAISYMTAKGIVDTGLIKDQNDLYVYTFSAPNGVIDEWEGCTCVYNIVNDMDIIQRTAPAQWGFHKYGTVITLGDPSKVNSIPNPDLTGDEMLYPAEDFYVRKMDLTNVLDSTSIFSSKSATQYDVMTFYDKFFEFISDDSIYDVVNDKRAWSGLEAIPAVKDRETYYKYYQTGIMYLFELSFSKGTSSDTGFLDISSFLTDFIAECYDTDQLYPKTIEDIKQNLTSRDPSFKIDEERLLSFIRLLGKLFRNDSGAISPVGMAFSEFTIMSTFLGNLNYIVRGHFYDVLLAWVRNNDQQQYHEIDVDFMDHESLEGITLSGESINKPGKTFEISCDYDKDEYVFNGWYDADGKLITTEEDYSFPTHENEVFLASFERIEPEEPEETEDSEEPSSSKDEKGSRKKKNRSSDSDNTLPIVLGIAGSVVLIAGSTAVALILIKRKKK